MTANELLVLAGAAATGAAVAILLAVAALRRARGAGPVGAAGADDLRRLARRIRLLNRIARRTERRLSGRVEELRRLLAQAGRIAPDPGGEAGDSAGPAETVDAPLPAFLEKQRDHILRLRLQGLEPIDIARRLDLPVGEIELTLRLHQERQEHARAGAGGE